MGDLPLHSEREAIRRQRTQEAGAPTRWGKAGRASDNWRVAEEVVRCEPLALIFLILYQKLSKIFELWWRLRTGLKGRYYVPNTSSAPLPKGEGAGLELFPELSVAS